MWALEKDNNELFFRIMRKVKFLAARDDVRQRDVMRAHSLTQIDSLVTDAQVAKGTEDYPHTDDEDDEGDEEETSDDGSEDGDVYESIVKHWNKERGFGYIMDPDYITDGEMASNEDIFFHISELNSPCHPNVGDKVQFYIWYNEAKERYEAYSVITENSEYWVDAN